MKPCPFCGVMLTASLVDAINDPNQKDEYCPLNPPKDDPDADWNALSESGKRLVGYAMLAAVAGR